MQDRTWPEYVRVLACLQLHSTLFGREKCLTASGVRLRGRDIAELTGLSHASVRRNLERLEKVGFCERWSTDEVNPRLDKNTVLIKCYLNPRLELENRVSHGASVDPTD